MTNFFRLIFSKETKWRSHTDEQPGLGHADAAARKEEQVFRFREIIQAVEMEEKKEVGQIRSRF